MRATDSARSPIPSPGRLGLMNPQAAERLAAIGWNTEDSIELMRTLSRAPDPDLALITLNRLKEALESAEDLPNAASWAALVDDLRHNESLRGRLLGLIGCSSALGDHLVAEPSKWTLLRDEFPSRGQMFARMLSAVDASPDSTVPDSEHNTATTSLETPGNYRAATHDPAAVNLLRVAYRDLLTVIAAHDVAHTVEHHDPVVSYAQLTTALSDLADAALTAALAVAAGRVFGDDEATARLGVIAMGKCGAQELNYISDVDVVFVAEPADPKSARLAGEMMRIGSMAFFEVDAALRPEGKAGDLVRTLDSFESYYKRWAKTWEFQALLKARPMTGDMELAEQWWNTLNPYVWRASERDSFVTDVQAMRRRVEANVPKDLRERELKLGRGGLRDVEFAVQLLQMVHGRSDDTLRVRSTIDALARLGAGGYVGRSDTAQLIESYEFLRLLEHRLQLQRVKRTHLLPADDDRENYRWLARAAGVQPEGSRSAREQLAERLRILRTRVRRLHEKIFYRPLLESIAAYDADALALSPEAMERQLAALGYVHPRNALNHLRALVGASQRRGRIQSLILPTLLEWLGETTDPDAGLLAYRNLSEEHQELSWFLRVLRDDHVVARRLMHILGTSTFVRNLMQKSPTVILDLSEGPLGPKLLENDAETIGRALTASAQRHRTPEAVISAARSLRRHELARIGSADILGLVDVPEVAYRLTMLWNAVIEAALSAVIREATPADGVVPATVAVIAMGRLGGREQSYGSDADVIFVCQPQVGFSEDEAVKWATDVCERMGNLLGTPSVDPPLDVDADLRPEGRNGALVRTLESYRAYYEKWAETWELQALLRASKCAGDEQLTLDFLHMADEFRYPEQGVPAKTVMEIRRMKARVDSERLPRGANPATHTKLGRGGLADVEWTVQLLTMQHAAKVKGLHTTNTLEALEAAAAAEIISETDAATLRASWMMAADARNALVLVKGKPTDEVPTQSKVLAAVAQICGDFADGSEFLNEYLRVTRLGRKAVDKVFWGE